MPPAPIPATKPVTASAASAEMGMPISRVNPIALATAAGARGCSEAKARTTNTNGISISPNAIHRPGAATPPDRVDATETAPISSAQKAGASSKVASRIARHMRRGTVDPRPLRRAMTPRPPTQPLTEPAVSPRTKYFWSEKKTISGRTSR